MNPYSASGSRLALGMASLLLLTAFGCGGSTDIVATEKAAAATPAATEPVASEPVVDTVRQDFAAAIAAALEKLSGMEGYTYTLRKQERVDGVLLKPQTLNNKIRHEPFSVYLRFTAPKDVEGKEAIYVEGQNDGKLIGHGVGLQGLLGTQHLDPRGAIAMMGNRNPITDSGMKNLLTKLQTLLDRQDFAELYEVRAGKSTEVDERRCRTFEIHNIKRSDKFPLAKSITTFDEEWGLPVRFQRYYWPSPSASEPHQIEDYTYLNVKLDAKLSDADFDPENPDYDF